MTLARRTRSVAFALLAAMVAAACSGDGSRTTPVVAAPARPVATEAAAGDGVLRLGAVVATSGALAADEAELVVALRDAVAWTNRQGGVGGKPVELLEADSASSLTQAAKVATELADAGADVLVVGCDLDLAATVARIARRLGRLAIGSCVLDDAFGPDTAGSSAFTIAPLASAVVDVVAKRMLADGLRSAVTVSSLVPFESAGLCQRFAARYRELGGSIVAELEIGPNDAPTSAIGGVDSLPATSVFLSCVPRRDVAGVLRTLRRARRTTPLVALLSADGLPWPDGTPNDVLFGPTANLWRPDAPEAPLVQAGVRGGLGLRTFVALDVLGQAVTKAGATSGALAWAEALRATTFSTAIGPVRFDARQRAIDLPVILARTTGDTAEVLAAP